MSNEENESAVPKGCIQGMLSQTSPRTVSDENRAVREANRRVRVFTGPEGGSQIRWAWKYGTLEPAVMTNTGWREEEDGNRIQVWFYEGWGWLSPDELSDLRQSDPRIAP